MVQNAEITRDTVTANLEHAIADNLSLYSRLSVVRNQSTGRFAPPAARYPGLLLQILQTHLMWMLQVTGDGRNW